MIIDPSIIRMGFDGTFELNDFSEPRLRGSAELIKNVLLFILFGKPGQYPSLPHIGLNIQSLLYEHFDDINEKDLSEQIVAQCEALAPFFNEGSIQIRKIVYRNKPSLMIHVDVEDEEPDHRNNINQFQIGITFNEVDKMVYNISEGRSM